MNARIIDALEQVIQTDCGPVCPTALGELPEGVESDYLDFLRRFNGGHSRDGYFRFFGIDRPGARNVVQWNKMAVWAQWYEMNSAFLFCENVFGQQYYLALGRRRHVRCLWLDDGKSSFEAASFSDFIEDVVLDAAAEHLYRALADRFIAQRKVTIPLDCHLAYKTPVCLGGASDSIDNLEVMAAIDHVLLSGQIAFQVKRLPKGSRVLDVLLDKEKGVVTLVTD